MTIKPGAEQNNNAEVICLCESIFAYLLKNVLNQLKSIGTTQIYV